MKPEKKQGRYDRIFSQLSELLTATQNPVSRMATVASVLHHKMDGFFWTGFYLLKDDKLLVGPYQGPVACQELEKNKGVCWAGINDNKTLIVPDVEKFPGHIACDSRSRSEVVIPIWDEGGRVIGVLDVDSKEPGQFDETDAAGLERIVSLLQLAG
ncbi:MAG: GAF domain-containing protein [Bacteroidales bacterium]|nr:GAF domain-containing protein [Bacteroidales bacterium]